MKYGKYNAGRMLPLAAFAAMAFATSCSNDSIADGGNQSADGKEGRTVELTATLNGDNSAATRVGMTKSDDGTTASLYWHSKDAILVQTVREDGTFSGAQFSTSAEDGATTATFSGKIADGQTLGKYAVYPFSYDHEFTGENALTYSLPSEYSYFENNFYEVKSNVFSKTENGTTTYPTPCAIPMVGAIGEENKIEFKHIGGLAVIRIDNMPSASGTLTVTADQQLSGEFTIEDLTATNPEIKTDDDAFDVDKKVTYTFKDAYKDKAGVFYLPLATGDYTNVKISLAQTDASGSSSVTYDKLTVTRAGVQALALKYSDGSLAKDESSSDGGGH